MSKKGSNCSVEKDCSTCSVEEGNNNTSSRASISPAIGWCFTFNNYTDESIQRFQQIIKQKCRLGFFNKEVGESGTPHLQGYIEFKTKGRPMCIFPKGAHWTKAKGNQDQNFKYCSKECHEDGMTFSYGFKPIVDVDIIDELRPFQITLKEMLLGPVNKGKVIWVYDPKGQLGKTEFLRYMYVKHGMPFSYGGKASDIVNLVFNHKDYLMRTNRAVMIYNFGRDTDPEKISYKSMEQIADGCISNTKFETGCFVCCKPHVLVLANCLPKETALTSDRWMLKTINNEMELVDYSGKAKIIEWWDDPEESLAPYLP